MKGARILTLGGAYVDFNVPGFPFGEEGFAPETEAVGGDYGISAGGSAVNFARACVQLGLDATFIGKIGTDIHGKVLQERLEHENIHPALIADRSVSTNIGFNAINEQGQTIMLVAGNANQALSPEDVAAKATSLLPEVDSLYLGSCLKLQRLLPAFNELAELAKEHDTVLIVDHGRVPKNLSAESRTVVQSLVEKADYYLPSRDEFLGVWQYSSIEVGLRSLAERTNATIVVKSDEKGAFSIEDGEIIRVPAFQVQPHNTAGAGDTFNAGFIAAQGEGLSLRASMELGCAAAALKISRDTLPTMQEVQDFLASQPPIKEVR